MVDPLHDIGSNVPTGSRNTTPESELVALISIMKRCSMPCTVPLTIHHCWLRGAVGAFASIVEDALFSRNARQVFVLGAAQDLERLKPLGGNRVDMRWYGSRGESGGLSAFNWVPNALSWESCIFFSLSIFRRVCATGRTQYAEVIP